MIEDGDKFLCSTCERTLEARREADAELFGCSVCRWWLNRNDFIGKVRQQAKEYAAHAIAEGWTGSGAEKSFATSVRDKGVYPFVINFELTQE